MAPADGQSLPQQIGRRQQLLAKLEQARERLERRAKERAKSEQAEYERKVGARDKRNGSRKGPKPKPPKATPDDHEQINLTDPDSRLMRKSKREGYTQSYNAQAVVDADGSQLILGGHVTTCASDANELKPGLEGVPEEVGTVSAVLADSGYVDSETWELLEQGGVDVYVAVSRQENHSQRCYDYRPTSSRDKPEKVIKDPRLLAMRDKLRTETGRRLYARRKQTVEPVFGIIKEVLGFTRFLLRGFVKAEGEWSLVRLAHNVKRLWRLQAA